MVSENKRILQEDPLHYSKVIFCCFAMIFIVLFTSGCSSRKQTHSIQKRQIPKNKSHLVVKGETLYSIAWQYGQNFHSIAKCNRISKPYIIYPKQILRISCSENYNRINSKQSDGSHFSNKNSLNNNKKGKKVKNVEQVTVLMRWRWPTKGRVVTPFNVKDGVQKGVDIAGKYNQSILAAESGKVVYSGNGLIGYGNLVIVKHNELFLTAYGYNSKLLVKEGDIVKSGQVIARMGRGSDNRSMLHFELRLNGKPLNPLRYLPIKK